MNQDELITEVIRICDQAGPPVRWISLTAVRRERCPWLTGWPDLFLIGTDAFCWREVKCGSTELTAAQDDWLAAIEHADGDADLWTERDLYDGSVRVELLALNGVTVPREPWIPSGATEAEIVHRRSLYAQPLS